MATTTVTETPTYSAELDSFMPFVTIEARGGDRRSRSAAITAARRRLVAEYGWRFVGRPSVSYSETYGFDTLTSKRWSVLVPGENVCAVGRDGRMAHADDCDCEWDGD